MGNDIYNHHIVTKAIIFATEKHQAAIRKGTEREPIPYIVHPMEAAAISATMTNDPNVIAAAMLHDVVEDAGVSIEMIKIEFNDIIAALVAGESENKRAGVPAEETWEIRKREAIEHLANAETNSKIITLSDKLSNIRALRRDYMRIGNNVWDRFNQKDPKMQAWYYTSLKEALKELGNHDAWKEFERLVDEVFKEQPTIDKKHICPKIDRSEFVARSKIGFADSKVVNIGYAEGILSDGRPYRLECWAEDQLTNLTIFVSNMGIEHYTSQDVLDYLEDEGLFWALTDDSCGGSALLFRENNGNEFWSANLVVGDEDNTYLDSVPLQKWD